MESAATLPFDGGRSAQAARVRGEDDLRRALGALGIAAGRPTIVLVGGAGELGEEDLDRLRPIFADALAPLAERVRACVVDGGTDAGVMQLMGEARAARHAAFPLIGVAAEGTVALPDRPGPTDGRASLDPNHTHFVFVPGSEWGDEAPWLGRVASAVAGTAASVTVVVDGGEIAWRDVAESVAAGRRVVVVAGTGRTADALAAALDGAPADPRASELASSGLVGVTDASLLRARLGALLGSPEQGTTASHGETTTVRDAMEENLVRLIDSLDDLGEREKDFVKGRWLDQVAWMERAAAKAQRRHYRLRLVTVVGAVVVPALVSLNVRGTFAERLAWVTFAVSLVVAASAAIEQFFNFGERWRHYRRTVEALKAEGWLFFQLAGDYEGAASRSAVFARFAARVEDLLREDVSVFVTQVVREKKEKDESRAP